MSDRLSELQRQRELLREHLDWLDREIAAEAGQSGAVPHPPQPAIPVYTPAPAYRAPLDPHEADAILAQYSKPPASIATQTKAGCILYFVVGIALLAVAGTVFYFMMTRMRGH
jgi:hypothetical protein